MFLNFRIPQATFYEMDSKYSRLKKHVSETKTDPSTVANEKDEDERSWPRSVFQTNIDRLQKFFDKHSNSNNDAAPLSNDDLQGLLQKGDNDSILPSLRDLPGRVVRSLISMDNETKMTKGASTRKQRILGFMLCLTMGMLCMALATLYIPVIVLKARKFAILFSFGSVFFLSSFSMLWGPMNHLKHLINVDRLPFLITYLVTLVGTIYYSLWIRSYVVTLIFALFQVGALIWYVVSYIPGGAHGLKFFSKLFYTFAAKTVTTTFSV